MARLKTLVNVIERSHLLFLHVNKANQLKKRLSMVVLENLSSMCKSPAVKNLSSTFCVKDGK